MGSPVSLEKSCRASQGWAKPFGDPKQPEPKLLLEQHGESSNEGLLASRNGHSRHTGISCSAAGLPEVEGIKSSQSCQGKGQLKKPGESNSNTVML